MKILITGSTGYIGKRLMPLLLNEGHTVVCSVRDTSRTIKHNEDEFIEIVEADFLKPDTLINIPKDIDVAYYLIHSMSNSSTDFEPIHSYNDIGMLKTADYCTLFNPPSSLVSEYPDMPIVSDYQQLHSFIQKTAS